MTNKPHAQTVPHPLLNAFLAPGNLFCDLVGVEDQDSRFLLRMFVNLTVYGKAAVILLVILT